ncbi:coil containing protein [Vibrio phage 2.275.O._10N.286.54.E11]|nr:coil containing protein [Vibrio phage 2.275.O._10N.286.54.E11]
MNNKILFETYLCTVNMSNNSFMENYQNEILPLLDSGNFTDIHYKLKELARISETTSIKGNVLDKLHQKAKLSVSESKLPLVDRIYSIGSSKPQSAPLAAAMITTAIIETAIPEVVLVPGIKVLHRAFINESDLPNGYTITSPKNTTFRWDGHRWNNATNGGTVTYQNSLHITEAALKQFEKEQTVVRSNLSEDNKPGSNLEKGFELVSKNGTKFRWAGAMWEMENSNGKMVPVPKDYKNILFKAANQEIIKHEQAEQAEAEAKAKAEEDAAAKKKADMESNFEFDDLIDDETDETHITDDQVRSEEEAAWKQRELDEKKEKAASIAAEREKKKNLKRKFKRDELNKRKQADHQRDGAKKGINPELRARVDDKKYTTKQPDIDSNRKAKDWIKNDRESINDMIAKDSVPQETQSINNKQALIKQIKQKLSQRKS